VTRGAKPGSEGPLVTVCRGCCCGSDRKHPGIDHDGQVRDLRSAVGRAGRVRVSDCLDVCDRSTVVVVQPSAAGRRSGGRPTWLGWVLDDDSIRDIAGWVEAGGPGLAPIPDVLDLATFRPPRRADRAAVR